MGPAELIHAALATAYGLRVHSVQPMAGGADPQASTFRADTWTGPVVAKAQSAVAASRAVAVADALAALAEPAVLTPIRTRDGRGFVEIEANVALVAWPMRIGRNGFEQHQGPGVLAELGRLLRRVHDLEPTGLSLPVDQRDARWRAAVLALVEAGPDSTDPVVDRLRQLVARQGTRLRRLAEAAQDLSDQLAPEPVRVLCHGDLHAGNVLVAPDHSLTVLDWDTACWASRERDLMFPGAGIGQTWTSAEHVSAFRDGYGEHAVDERAIAYYRCDRICEDVVIYARSVLDPDSPSRLRDIVTLESQFQPGDVVDRAERSLTLLRR